MSDGETAARWARSVPRNRNTASPSYLDEWYWQQCGGCRFFRPLVGALGDDWGACSNPASLFDAKLKFEHDGCEAFVGARPDDLAPFA